MMKNTKPLCIGFVLGILTCGLATIGKIVVFPSPSEALPFCSTYKEEFCGFGLIPDYSYKLEAKISDNQFKRFVYLVGFPESSRRNPHLYVIDEPGDDYERKAEYVGGMLYYEESRY